MLTSMASSEIASRTYRPGISPELLRSEKNQIVVAIPYPDLVIGTLEKLKSGVTAYQVESSDELGLALLQLTGKLKRGFPARMRRWYPEMLPHLDPKEKMGFVMAAIKCGDCQIFRWLV